ncbi:hypothetical protein CEXT_228811 [Caerostris extrusa]|uniref:Uncharacterized protein n=1 Tax=Caerostris extrusa TaxID=172846 RepID=A0AAV4NS60_CAEEX|nr:hypothetical protein CEXT_228811 [Caerostris extrusa]
MHQLQILPEIPSLPISTATGRKCKSHSSGSPGVSDSNANKATLMLTLNFVIYIYIGQLNATAGPVLLLDWRFVEHALSYNSDLIPGSLDYFWLGRIEN